MEKPSDLRSKDSGNKIVKAIEEAELNTSGEIRVHIESVFKGDPYLRAACIFTKLGMHKTFQRNAVLIYIAYDSHKFAIIGDSGINEKVGADFWNDVKDRMSSDFAAGEFSQGVVTAIHEVGVKLKSFFPYQTGDINEQSDEVSYGE